MRDDTAKKEKETSERSAKALSELNTIEQEEEKYEPPNKIKDTRGRPEKITVDERGKHLN